MSYLSLSLRITCCRVSSGDDINFYLSLMFVRNLAENVFQEERKGNRKEMAEMFKYAGDRRKRARK